MQFPLLGQDIEISEGRKNYMKILSYYKAMATQAEAYFKQEYNDIFGMVFLTSTYAEKFLSTYGSNNYMDRIVQRYVAKTRQYLTNYGVYNLSDTAIWNKGIVAQDRSVSRLQYAFNEFFDDCLFSSDEVKDDVIVPRIKSKFSGSYFPTCLYNDIMGLCVFVLNYLDDNRVAEIQFVYQKDSSEAEAIYKNLLDGNIPTSDQEKLAYSLIKLDPSNKLYYEHIFCRLPQAKYEIAAIAQVLSIDLSDLIEKDILSNFDLKAISCEEDALEMMDDLKVSMEKFCVTSSSRKTELEKILHDFDIKARTYDDVLYDTRELRSKAEKDDQNLFELHGDVNSIDKESCSRFLAEIEYMQCTTVVKNKHLQLLNARITAIDNEYLGGLLSSLEISNEDECNCLKDVINQYDAPEATKTPYITRVEKRLYTIWAAEDFERFSDLFKQTPVGDSAAVGETCALIQREGRTETKEQLVKALYLLNENEVAAAAKYALAKESGMLASLLNMGKKESYMILTLNGRLMHLAIEESMKTQKEAKGSGLLGGLGKLKNSFGFGKAAGTDKTCPNCGKQINQDAKFCPSCGNKLE